MCLELYISCVLVARLSHVGRWHNRAEGARSGCRLEEHRWKPLQPGGRCAEGSLHLQARRRGVRLLGRSPAGIASAPAAAPPGVPLPPRRTAEPARQRRSRRCPRPSPPTPGPRARSPYRGRRGTDRAGLDLTWGCTSPRPRAAPRSPSRVVPAPRRPKPLTPLPPPCPRPPARCQRAAAAWRHGSHGRTPGRWWPRRGRCRGAGRWPRPRPAAPAARRREHRSPPARCGPSRWRRTPGTGRAGGTARPRTPRDPSASAGGAKTRSRAERDGMAWASALPATRRDGPGPAPPRRPAGPGTAGRRNAGGGFWPG